MNINLNSAPVYNATPIKTESKKNNSKPTFKNNNSNSEYWKKRLQADAAMSGVIGILFGVWNNRAEGFNMFRKAHLPGLLKSIAVQSGFTMGFLGIFTSINYLFFRKNDK